MNLYVFTIIATQETEKGEANTNWITMHYGIANDSFELFQTTLKEFTKDREKMDDHVGWIKKPKIFNQEKFSALKILGELKKKLPDLVENAVTREKLEKLEKALED